MQCLHKTTHAVRSSEMVSILRPILEPHLTPINTRSVQAGLGQWTAPSEACRKRLPHTQASDVTFPATNVNSEMEGKQSRNQKELFFF